MDYYLPTTVKLLDAYRDLDAQPIQSETISQSKHEIEGALDSLNVAFEKLLIRRSAIWQSTFPQTFRCCMPCLHRKAW